MVSDEPIVSVRFEEVNYATRVWWDLGGRPIVKSPLEYTDMAVNGHGEVKP